VFVVRKVPTGKIKFPAEMFLVKPEVGESMSKLGLRCSKAVKEFYEGSNIQFPSRFGKLISSIGSVKVDREVILGIKKKKKKGKEETQEKKIKTYTVFTPTESQLHSYPYLGVGFENEENNEKGTSFNFDSKIDNVFQTFVGLKYRNNLYPLRLLGNKTKTLQDWELAKKGCCVLKAPPEKAMSVSGERRVEQFQFNFEVVPVVTAGVA
jgi:hypothetical protein